MHIITDKKELKKACEIIRPETIFDTENLPFRIFQYEKGELLAGPGIDQRDLLFLISGTVHIYGIGNDAQLVPVNLGTCGTLIGDVEFVTGKSSPVFGEAATEVTCLALAVEPYREVIHQDVKFLHYLIRSLSEKVYLTSSIDAPVISVEEKLLHYLTTQAKNHELKGINQATLQLRCSRRQLQRVLKELCEQGKIEKTGKGCYRLT